MKLKDVPMKAFPHPQPKLMYQEWSGMDLRDYFATRAMQAIIDVKPKTITPPQDVAEIAYFYADAMMSERKKK
jgi:hypothetical protein